MVVKQVIPTDDVLEELTVAKLIKNNLSFTEEDRVHQSPQLDPNLGRVQQSTHSHPTS
jgi:hypothetical protein